MQPRTRTQSRLLQVGIRALKDKLVTQAPYPLDMPPLVHFPNSSLKDPTKGSLALWLLGLTPPGPPLIPRIKTNTFPKALEAPASSWTLYYYNFKGTKPLGTVGPLHRLSPLPGRFSCLEKWRLAPQTGPAPFFIHPTPSGALSPV